MDSILRDLRFAVRSVAKHPIHTLVVVLTLALGIGANTAIFSVIDGVLLDPLPYERGDRIVRLRQEAPLAGIRSLGFSVPEVEDFRGRNQAFDAVVEYHSMPFTFLGRKEPERLQTGVVSAEYFDVLGIEALLGRTFEPGDDVLGAEPVLVLSHGYWQRQLGGAPDVVGTTFEMNDRIHTVVGVLPPIPAYPDDNAVYMPTPSCPFRHNVRENRQGRMLTVFARLADGVGPDKVQADLDAVAGSLQREIPELYVESSGYRASATPLLEELTRDARPTFLLLLGAVGFVLMIVCANVANLTLARMVHRERELAVRTALGAGRSRLVRQLLTESTLLALLGGAGGLVLARASLGMLVDFAAGYTPRAEEVALDGSVLAFALGVSVLTGLAFGLVPALPGRADVSAALRESGGERGAAGGRGAVQGALVASQVAVSFVLLIFAGLMLESFLAVLRVDPGYRSDNVMTMTLDLNWTKYSQAQDYLDFYQPLLAAVQSQPGVRSAAIAGTVPLGTRGVFDTSFQVEGAEVDDPDLRPRAELHIASSDFFDTVGARLASGRAFSLLDHRDAAPVAIVNRSLAERYWGDRDPVGQRLSTDGGQTWLEVVGVSGDVRWQGLDQEVQDEIYLPFLQVPIRRMSLLVKTATEPSSTIGQLRDAVYAIDPEQPIADVRTLEALRDESLASRRLTAVLLSLFAALALAVTAAGISGVLAFSVNQRTREIGVRMAMGARRLDVLRQVMRQGMTMVVLGLVLGVVVAALSTRVLRSLLYAVEPTDVPTFAAVAAVLAAVAASACLIPALKATSVDPAVALRGE
jgi:predicted permease